MLPGLNTEGTNIRVLPQYTPSNTALDLSALGSGFSQGMQLVGQAQQARRLRDIMAEEQARRPLRDIIAQRQMAEASQPIERTLSSFIDQLPEGGGLGRYEIREVIDPRTQTVEQVNQFVETLATPEQVEAQNEKLRSDAARQLRMDMESQAKIRNLDAQTEDIVSGRSAARGRIGPGEIYQRTIEKMAAELGFTPERMRAINESPYGSSIISKLYMARDPLSGDKAALTPDEMEFMRQDLVASDNRGASAAPAAPTQSAGGATVSFQMPGANARPAVSVDNRGIPVFASEAEFNAAFDAGLIPIGTRVSVAGADFDVQE